MPTIAINEAIQRTLTLRFQSVVCDAASEGESGEEPSGDGEEAIGDGEDDETTELPCLVKHLFPQNYDIFL